MKPEIELEVKMSKKHQIKVAGMSFHYWNDKDN
jgi:hypothetical protein